MVYDLHRYDLNNAFRASSLAFCAFTSADLTFALLADLVIPPPLAFEFAFALTTFTVFTPTTPFEIEIVPPLVPLALAALAALTTARARRVFPLFRGARTVPTVETVALLPVPLALELGLEVRVPVIGTDTVLDIRSRSTRLRNGEGRFSSSDRSYSGTSFPPP
ncbi:hypothetical protein K474DRAFT_1663959 [Panus rudis PR-1116 ss-1]|nr:hypothetical protein K474DRAFT_1663959 [Panus rudis PR-1116 ss-1]